MNVGTQEYRNAISIARIEERLGRMEDDLNATRKEVEVLTSSSARVRGGIFVVLVIGGFIGWLTTLGSTLVKFWPFH